MTLTEHEEEIRAEIDALRAQIKPLQERINHLHEILRGPYVIPVLVYYRYHQRYEDADRWNRTLAEAFGALNAMEENGSGSAVGVEVGGHMITVEEWATDPRRPAYQEMFAP